MAELELRHQGSIEEGVMEGECPTAEDAPRTRVSPRRGTPEMNDRPPLKETDEPWEKPTESTPATGPSPT